MKKVVLIIVLLLGILPLMAQHEDMSIEHARIQTGAPVTFSFGPRVGINYSSVRGSGIEGVRGIVGVTAGGFGEMRLRNWFALSLDILYSSQGYETDKQKWVNSNIIFPVMVNFYVVGDLALKFGLQPGVLASSQSYKGQVQSMTTDEFQRFTLDVPVGISCKLWQKVQVDLRYNIGLLNMSSSDKRKMYNSTFGLSVVYQF